jgi:intracellular multiplication protein IcmX
MKNSNKIKQVVLSTLVMALASVGVNAYAADPAGPTPSAGDFASLTQIVAQIYGQIKAGYTESNARLQQVDSYLNSFISTGTSQVIPQVSAGVESNASSNPVLTQPVTMPLVPSTVQAANSLSTTNLMMAQIPEAAVFYSSQNLANASNLVYLPWYQIPTNTTPTGSLLQDPTSTRANISAQYLDNLTVYLPASDSFIADNALASKLDKSETLANNNYFNFMNYFEPTYGAYNTTPISDGIGSALTMARGYPEFLTLSNQPIADDLSWTLSQYEQNGQIAPQYLNQLAGVIKGTAYNNSYKTFLLQERQYYSARSLINGLLSQIWVERAPVKLAAKPVLAASADPVKTQNQYFTPGDSTASASPLQMQRYERMHRVEDPNWYAQMSTASPATIAREQLYVSAQLLAAAQQSHEDSEKLLVATLLNAQASVEGSMKNNLKMSESQLKADLCSALGPNSQGVCSGVKKS